MICKPWTKNYDKKANFCLVYLGDVDCIYPDSCANGNYECEGEGCQIECSGSASCDASTFTCTDSCSVTCGGYGGYDACSDTTFYFNGGDSTVLCNKDAACQDTRFIANNGSNIAFVCQGDSVCDDIVIDMRNASTFSIICSGDDTCEEVDCTCDTDGCEKTGDFNCDVTKK